MRQSESLANLAAALAKAQAQVKPALKDSANPFHKSKYADFSSVLSACEDALAANGLALVQAPITSAEGIGVDTMILHESGEWIAQEFTLPMAKEDPQGGGSCITYARRYALEGFLRIRREDDDGNAAAQAVERKQEQLREQALKLLEGAARQGREEMEQAWKMLTPQQREACKKDLERLKKMAPAKKEVASA